MPEDFIAGTILKPFRNEKITAEHDASERSERLGVMRSCPPKAG